MRKTSVVPIVALALALCGLALPKAASAQIAVGISVQIGPPALPVYVQPMCPGPNYIWAPGYWAYGPDGYYWVPGTWVLAPEPGYLWTPGWWGFAGGFYVWHPGYWGRHVGFYGGINYGFGYFGNGYAGGEWRGDHFFYNRAVSRVNINVERNVYINRTVERNVYVNNHVSYNGGPHGVNARPTAEQQRWDSERHMGPTANQQRHMEQAQGNRQLHYSDNHGRPPIAATQRPTQFSGPGVVRGGSQFRPPQNNRGPQPNNQRPENRTYNRPEPNNQRPENRNYNAPRNEGRPGGNRPEARPQQQRGNQGGDHGRDNGGRDGGGRNDGGR
jgi:hypothetical protein